jgi:cytidyltransferase-like protein
MKKKPNIVLVFGVFDLLHPGHVSFLKQAQKVGDVLIIVVACDEIVKKLKQRKPHFNERQREAHIRSEFKKGVRVVLGDRKLGAYSTIKHFKPNCICVGYDQRALLADLRERMHKGFLPRIRIIRLRAHKPHRYHTAILKRGIL